MKKKLTIIAFAAILALAAFISWKLTFANSSWVIGFNHPNAELRIISVNSPNFYFWPTLAALFGIPMTDPDHYLQVSLRESPEPLRIRDFRNADELYLEMCEIADLSAYMDPKSRLSTLVFINCDFNLLPEAQRNALEPYSEKIPNSFYLPYETKQTEQGAAANP